MGILIRHRQILYSNCHIWSTLCPIIRVSLQDSVPGKKKERKLFCPLILVHLNLLVNNGGVQTLGVLDVDGLHVGVQLLLGILLVVTLTRDAHTQTEGDTLDTGFPDLLVQLGVETDVLGALDITHGWLTLAFVPHKG